MLIASDVKKSSVAPLEPDTYPARCVQVIDIGVQKSEAFNTSRRQAMLVFEIPSERITLDGEDKPRMLAGTYTVSLNPKGTLRKLLESWRGKAFTDAEVKAFDLKQLINLPCMLSVIQKTSQGGNVFAAIGGVSKYPKNFPPMPDAETTLFAFDLDTIDDLEKMEVLPEWIQKRIKESETYKELSVEKAADESFQNINADDLPFGND